jgi:hypothetical protein
MKYGCLQRLQLCFRPVRQTSPTRRHIKTRCGDVTDYVFTPNTLTVKFHDGRPANVFKITKYTYTNDSVRIDWLNGDGKESVTVFAEFTGNTTTMAQQQNGDKPRRPFHRC